MKDLLGEELIHDLDVERADMLLAITVQSLLVFSSLGILFSRESLFLAFSDLFRKLSVAQLLGIAQRFIEPIVHR